MRKHVRVEQLEVVVVITGVHPEILPADRQDVPVQMEELQTEMVRNIEDAHAALRQTRFIGRERRQNVREHVAVFRHGDLSSCRIGEKLLCRRHSPATATSSQKIEIPAAHRVSYSPDGHDLGPELLLRVEHPEQALFVVDREIQGPLGDIPDQVVGPGELHGNDPVVPPRQHAIEPAPEEQRLHYDQRGIGKAGRPSGTPDSSQALPCLVLCKRRTRLAVPDSQLRQRVETRLHVVGGDLFARTVQGMAAEIAVVLNGPNGQYDLGRNQPFAGEYREEGLQCRFGTDSFLHGDIQEDRLRCPSRCTEEDLGIRLRVSQSLLVKPERLALVDRHVVRVLCGSFGLTLASAFLEEPVVIQSSR